MARILVVDDNRAHRRFIADVLTLEGHDVSVAESGQQTLEMLEKQAFDLITLDEQMPGMTGLECYERMKQRPVRVVFITVFGNEPALVALREARIPVLVKPLTSRQIVDAIDKALSRPVPANR